MAYGISHFFPEGTKELMSPRVVGFPGAGSH